MTSPPAPNDAHPAPPPRVRITAARPDSQVEPPPHTDGGDPAALYIRSLIRSQLRLAIVCAVAFVVVLALVPVLFGVLPWLDEARVGPVPVSWIVLGCGMFPVIIGIAALYERAATRNEARYRSLADDADDDA